MGSRTLHGQDLPSDIPHVLMISTWANLAGGTMKRCSHGGVPPVEGAGWPPGEGSTPW